MRNSARFLLLPVHARRELLRVYDYAEQHGDKCLVKYVALLRLPISRPTKLVRLRTLTSFEVRTTTIFYRSDSGLIYIRNFAAV